MKYLLAALISVFSAFCFSYEAVIYYTYDQVGNPTAAIDKHQGLIATRDTVAYGDRQISTGQLSAFGDIGFTGQIDRANNSLVYFNSRYYSPHLRRFISPDPITVLEGDYKHIERYGYGNSNPVNQNDPSGNAAETPFDIASAAVGWAMFADDMSRDDYSSAALSGLAATYDSIAVAIPFLPGGASWLNRAGRFIDKAPTPNFGGFGPMYRKADNQELENILTSYYGANKDGDRVGNGGLADALRYEKATGELLSPAGHEQKVFEMRRRLQGFIKKADNQPPGTYKYLVKDVEFAHELLRDLNDSIKR